ncbi:MAG: hypothetical protein GKR93_12050 [Gammaproteobacteria bacterium]|nr:hypothetical protein [Gammaproteobacteria bacterium]
MKKLLSVFLIVVLLALTGCGSLPWNEQNNAGLTNVDLEGCDAEEGVDGQLFCNIHIIDGKEKADVNVEIIRDIPNNTITAKYSAKNVEAFDGQAIRGEVEKAVADTFRDVLPDMTKEIIKAIVPGPDI